MDKMNNAPSGGQDKEDEANNSTLAKCGGDTNNQPKEDSMAKMKQGSAAHIETVQKEILALPKSKTLVEMPSEKEQEAIIKQVLLEINATMDKIHLEGSDKGDIKSIELLPKAHTLVKPSSFNELASQLQESNHVARVKPKDSLKQDTNSELVKDSLKKKNSSEASMELLEKTSIKFQGTDSSEAPNSFNELAKSSNVQLPAGLTNCSDISEKEKYPLLQKTHTAEQQNSFEKLAAAKDSTNVENAPAVTFGKTHIYKPTKSPEKLHATTKGATSSTSAQSQSGKQIDMEDACKFWKTFSDEQYINSTIRCEVPEYSMCSLLPKSLPDIKIANIPPKTTVDEIIRDMIDNNKNATTVVEIGEHRFECIAAVLKVYSIWFQERDFRLKHFKFSENDVPHKAFMFFYEWTRCYKPVEEDLALELLQATRHLGVDLLQPECWKLLCDDSNREEKAFRMFVECKKYPLLSDLRHVMLSRVHHYSLELVSSEGFRKLNITDVLELLGSDTFGVNSELEVLFSALTWVDEDLEERQKYMNSLIHCIRFGHMSLQTLVDLKDLFLDEMKIKYEPVLYYFSMDPLSLDLVMKAIWFIGLRVQFKDNEAFFKQCLVHKIPAWYGRKLVYHANCPYHVKIPCEETPELTISFTQFKSYINFLQCNYHKYIVEDVDLSDEQKFFLRKEPQVDLENIRKLEQDYAYFQGLKAKADLEKQKQKNI